MSPQNQASEGPAISDTFNRPCLDCGSTVRVIAGATQDHDCRPATDSTDLVAHAWWAGFDQGYAAAARDSGAVS